MLRSLFFLTEDFVDFTEQTFFLLFIRFGPQPSEIVYRCQTFGETVQGIDQCDDFGAGKKLRVQARTAKWKSQ